MGPRPACSIARRRLSRWSELIILGSWIAAMKFYVEAGFLELDNVCLLALQGWVGLVRGSARFRLKGLQLIDRRNDGVPASVVFLRDHWGGQVGVKGENI